MSDPARFQDCNSREHRSSLCLLYADGGAGEYLGSVWLRNDRQWVWEIADTEDEDEEDMGMGLEKTRRLAKRALRKALKNKGVL